MATIHDLPVEMLQRIFHFYKNSILEGFKWKHDPCDNDGGAAQDIQDIDRHRLMASQSPVLNIGAVCKHWQSTTFQCPKLWTDIFLSLEMSVEAQTRIVKTWAGRSTVHRLYISIAYHRHPLWDAADQDDHEQKLDPLLEALTSLAGRWQSLDLDAPSYIFHLLLGGFPAQGPLRLDYLQLRRSEYYAGEWEGTDTSPTIEPTHFKCENMISSSQMEELMRGWSWKSLVSVTIATEPHMALNLIRHAPNLKYGQIWWTVVNRLPETPVILEEPIINTSLVDLTTDLPILQFLTLSSLSCLDLVAQSDHSVEDLQGITGFLIRSQPKLKKFTLHYRESCWVEPAVDERGLQLWRFLRGLSSAQADVVVQNLTKLFISSRFIDSNLEIPSSSLDRMLLLWRDDQRDSETPVSSLGLENSIQNLGVTAVVSPFSRAQNKFLKHHRVR